MEQRWVANFQDGHLFLFMNMDKPLFTVAIIMKNESKTLPRLAESLKEFLGRGGEWVGLDTGSSDNSVEVARSLGCKVTEIGEKYVITIDEDMAKKLNEKFIVDGEKPIAKGGDRIFNFSGARNEVASLASNDIVSFVDCDEAFTKLDIDALNQKIKEGVGQFEYNFVFAHNQYGGEAIKFIQSKMYDRRKLHWVNLIHECLFPLDDPIIKINE